VAVQIGGYNVRPQAHLDQCEGRGQEAGADTDSERAIRWLIALMVLCCDPLAIALTAAASARGKN
jgi:hypothetical protein